MIVTLLVVALSPLADHAACVKAYYRPPWSSKGGRTTRERQLDQRCASVWSVDGKSFRGGVCPNDFTSGAVLALAPADAHIEHLDAASRQWELYCRVHGHSPPPREWRRMYEAEPILWITDAATNLSKSDLGPHEWCPPSPYARRRAAPAIRSHRRRFGLPIDPDEAAGLAAWATGECLSP